MSPIAWHFSARLAHIVMVDDEAANVRLLSRCWLRVGFHTVTALTDARELAPLLVESPVDLVITDLHMPGSTASTCSTFSRR